MLAAFVTTNSVCQGQQASEVWPAAFERGVKFVSLTPRLNGQPCCNNAGVTVVIGLGKIQSA
jgi:hypothetical protein